VNAGLDPAGADPGLLERIRTINVGLIVMAAISLPFAVQYTRLGLSHMTVAVLLTATVAIATLVWLRRSHDTERAGLVAGITTLALLVLSNFTSGGFYDPNFGWLYVVPLIGAAVASRRAVWLLTSLVIAITLVFWVLPQTGVNLVNHVPESARGVQSLFNRVSAEVAITVLVVVIVARHQRHETRIRRLANYDMLTELPNRRYLEAELTRYLATDTGDDRLAILLIDLDRFKTINDSLGHRGGDELLREVARRIGAALPAPARGECFVARFGGDEFVVALERCADEAAACELAAALVQCLESPFRVEGYELFPGGSIGIAFAGAGERWEDVLRRADNALHEAKRAGGGCFAKSSAELIAAEERKMALESKLRRALDREEFELAYQPLVDGRSGAIVGCEALLRWNSDAGPVSPAEFIPLAEQTGEIRKIGRWVLEEACRQQVAWTRGGAGDVKISVNVSPLQLRAEDYLAGLGEVIASTGIDPARLELEMTESALIDGDDSTLRVLEAIRALGVELVLDDFGTGYSSLSYLQRYPFATIKVDRSFVARMHEDEHDARIVASITSLARSLKMRVVAEGVEESAQVEQLLWLECDLLQGYYFSRPVPASAFAALLGAGSLPAQARLVAQG
jgi:diguanylate cyclase (GGDEF)-like protein